MRVGQYRHVHVEHDLRIEHVARVLTHAVKGFVLPRVHVVKLDCAALLGLEQDNTFLQQPDELVVLGVAAAHVKPSGGCTGERRSTTLECATRTAYEEMCINASHIARCLVIIRP